MKNILIIDIETTGFLNQGGSIVEIGIVSLDLDTGNIKEVFSSLIREKILTGKHRAPPLGWIFNNSDLTVEAVRDAPGETEVLLQVQAILNRYPLGCTAFNKKFDFDFLKSRSIGVKELPCPMILSTDVCKIPNKNGCSGFKWPKVGEAFKFFYPDIEYTEKHRGLDDAKHEAMIVYKLYQLDVFKI